MLHRFLVLGVLLLLVGAVSAVGMIDPRRLLAATFSPEDLLHFDSSLGCSALQSRVGRMNEEQKKQWREYLEAIYFDRGQFKFALFSDSRYKYLSSALWLAANSTETKAAERIECFFQTFENLVTGEPIHKTRAAVLMTIKLKAGIYGTLEPVERRLYALGKEHQQDFTDAMAEVLPHFKHLPNASVLLGEYVSDIAFQTEKLYANGDVANYLRAFEHLSDEDRDKRFRDVMQSSLNAAVKMELARKLGAEYRPAFVQELDKAYDAGASDAEILIRTMLELDEESELALWRKLLFGRPLAAGFLTFSAFAEEFSNSSKGPAQVALALDVLKNPLCAEFSNDSPCGKIVEQIPPAETDEHRQEFDEAALLFMTSSVAKVGFHYWQKLGNRMGPQLDKALAAKARSLPATELRARSEQLCLAAIGDRPGFEPALTSELAGLLVEDTCSQWIDEDDCDKSSGTFEALAAKSKPECIEYIERKHPRTRCLGEARLDQWIQSNRTEIDRKPGCRAMMPRLLKAVQEWRDWDGT